MAKTTKKKPAPKAKLAKAKPAKAKPAKPAKAKLRGKKILLQPPAPLARDASAAVLDRLWAVVQSRRDADPAISHSARLLARGTAKVAQKFGEEAVECLIEATSGTLEGLIGESADVLYHLIVLWVNAGLRPDAVWRELERREGISGIAEKAARAQAMPPQAFPLASARRTKKIP